MHFVLSVHIGLEVDLDWLVEAYFFWKTKLPFCLWCPRDRTTTEMKKGYGGRKRHRLPLETTVLVFKDERRWRLSCVLSHTQHRSRWNKQRKKQGKWTWASMAEVTMETERKKDWTPMMYNRWKEKSAILSSVTPLIKKIYRSAIIFRIVLKVI